MQPVLEAIAITAAVKLRWPEFDLDRSKIILINGIRLDVPIMESPLNFVLRLDGAFSDDMLPDNATFEVETIGTVKFWTGSEHIWLGYGPRSDVLAINDGQLDELLGYPVVLRDDMPEIWDIKLGRPLIE